MEADMSKPLFRSIQPGTLLAISFAMACVPWLQPARAAEDNPSIVGVVRDPNGDFVFDKPNIEIEPGTSVLWVPHEVAPHRLVKDPDSQAPFQDTGVFNGNDLGTAIQKFTTPTTLGHPIAYHCAIHPGTMKGTISVKPADFVFDNPSIVGIVRDPNGDFVFDKPNIEIEPGISVLWVPHEVAGHQLVKDPDSQAPFQDTGVFNGNDLGTAIQKFTTPTTSGHPIAYHCAIHPSTMKGTISVKPAN
jgi:plastocyanin